MSRARPIRYPVKPVLWRAFALGILVLATGCGAAIPVSVGSQPLSAKEWCTEYRAVTADLEKEFNDPKSEATVHDLGYPALAAAFEKLRSLAEKAPLDVRDDLRALFTLPAAPPPPPTPEQVERWADTPPVLDGAARWILDNCGPGDVPPPEPPLPPDLSKTAPPDLTQLPQPVGDWETVQEGRVGDSRWRIFRTDSKDGGVCVSFEADPSYIDWDARLRAHLPPGMWAPPVPPPSPPDLIPKYKGKSPQCGPKPDLFERSDPVVFWVEDQDETNRYNVLAGLVVPEARSLTISFKEGGERIVMPVKGTFVLTYDVKLHVVKLVPDLGDRSRIVCDQLPRDGLPADMPEFLGLGCHGSYRR